MEKFITDKFGYTIAFLLPGFVTMCGLRNYSDLIDSWLNKASDTSTGITDVVYVILASLSIGIMISAMRWIVFDRILLRKTDNKFLGLDYSKLQSSLVAYIAVVEGHYQFYQFYANMSISILIYSLLTHSYFATYPQNILWIVIIEIILFWASRGCFDKTYKKISDLLNNNKLKEV